MTRRSLVALIAVGLIAIVASCDSSDSTTTGTITDLPAGHLCLMPEDSGQGDLQACFPLSTEDAARVHIGDCIRVTVPNQLESDKRDDPLRSIHVLDRTCKRP